MRENCIYCEDFQTMIAPNTHDDKVKTNCSANLSERRLRSSVHFISNLNMYRLSHSHYTSGFVHDNAHMSCRWCMLIHIYIYFRNVVRGRGACTLSTHAFRGISRKLHAQHCRRKNIEPQTKYAGNGRYVRIGGIIIIIVVRR